MAPRFQNIKPGDQIEMPAKRASLCPERDNRDPERQACIRAGRAWRNDQCEAP